MCVQNVLRDISEYVLKRTSNLGFTDKRNVLLQTFVSSQKWSEKSCYDKDFETLRQQIFVIFTHFFHSRKDVPNVELIEQRMIDL